MSFPLDKNPGIDYDSHGSEASKKILREDSISIAKESVSSPRRGIEFMKAAKSFIKIGARLGITSAITCEPSDSSTDLIGGNVPD
ncbi:MAG: hypothetical protein Q8M16_11145 [Pirellulaceae bacterium]|nr:hypothetical protein [Pirellulaceae bacterium]